MRNQAVWVAALVLSSGTAAALEGGFNAWDLDGDGAISVEEFDDGVLDQYYGVTGLDENMLVAVPDAWEDVDLVITEERQTWDINTDGELNLREYVDARFDELDADDDGVIVQKEWARPSQDSGTDR